MALAVSSHNCAIAIFQQKYACFLDDNCQEYISLAKIFKRKNHHLLFYTSLVDYERCTCCFQGSLFLYWYSRRFFRYGNKRLPSYKRSAILDFRGGFRWLLILSLCIDKAETTLNSARAAWFSGQFYAVMCRAYVIMYIQKTYTKIKRKIKKVKKTGQKYCLSIKNLYETYALTFFPKMWVESMARIKVHSHSPRLRVVVNWRRKFNKDKH